MSKRLLSLTAIFAAITCTSAFADNYKIIIDAGSTGTRVHLFQYNEEKSLPVIKEIFAENTKPGLSAFENNPQDAGKSLKKILDDTLLQLKSKNIHPEDVQINVLATAGMRLLPNDKQEAIYKNVRSFITENHYDFKLGQIETIPGKMEAIYGWLDLNYLANNLQNNKKTFGSIDMGGASTQIAFATANKSKPDDEFSFELNGQHYTVFAKSFLGLGQDQARDTMNKESEDTFCYPTGYQINPTASGKFNFADCKTQYTKVIKPHNVTQEILPTDQQEFVAFSGAFYTYNFFNSDKSPNQAPFETAVNTTCSKPWTQLQHDYPQVADKYLATYCANAVYMDDLFYGDYKLKDQQLSVVAQVNNQDLDWTLGAMLYSLLK